MRATMGAAARPRGMMISMALFVAHYTSPNAAVSRGKGLFEFESEARLGSKAIAHDARMAMLEKFGSDAVSWNVDSIERKRVRANKEANGQMELDFRDAPKRSRRKTVERH